MRRSVLSILAMVLFLSATAQNKKIQVLVENDWQEVESAYPGRVNQIESLLRDTIIYNLNYTYPFFDFTKDSVEYKLKIKILDPLQKDGNTARHAIVYQIVLTGSPIRSNAEMVTLSIKKFGTSYSFPGEYYSFVGWLTGHFIVGLNQFNDFIIEKILSHIPITNDAFFLSVPKTWAIPTSFKISRIARESLILIEFRPSEQVYGIKVVESIVNSAVCDIEIAHTKYSLPDSYPLGCLIGTHLNGPTDISDSIYKRKYVYVTRYKLFKTDGLVFDNNIECNVYNQ